jgi:predicted secreted protein
MLVRKAIITTIVAAVVFACVYLVFAVLEFSLEDLIV